MSDIAISVKNVSKTFRIPHEKVSSVRGAVVNVFRKKGYEEFKALDDVSFEVKKGEFFGIIGRNGSGKSTLLKILAGIYQPDNGEVKIDGMISPFLELGIGFNPELSGRDNVYLNATVLGMTKKQIDKKFDDIVKFSELERFIDQKLKNYSSGMQVRLAFSVSIHANREILLMDEVLAVGDSNFQSKCLSEFAKYRDAGKTVILVAHDIALVQRYCDRVLLLKYGKVVNIGNSEEIGNEYIEQNIVDEEERMSSDVVLEESSGLSRIVKILDIDFLDEKNGKKNIFKTGEKLSVRVNFEVNNLQKAINFGLALHSDDGYYIFGTNTFIDDSIEKNNSLKNGYFKMDFQNIPLKNNSYYVKVAIYGENILKIYDFKEKSKLFKVVSKSKSHGNIELSYNWN